MEVIALKSFHKSLKSCPKYIQEAVRVILNEKLPAAKSLQESGLDYTKMEGTQKGEKYYRIRVGNYRIGIENINPNIIVIVIMKRNDMYKFFPPKQN